MSVGWGAMSGAAINIILAPWFQRRRGLAVSLAFNGATLGGVIVTPALHRARRAARLRARAHVAAARARSPPARDRRRRHAARPDALGLGPDGDPPAPRAAEPAVGGGRWRADALRTWRFWSVSAPFALGLAAQVGVLTHLVALVTPALGADGAARAVGRRRRRRWSGAWRPGFVVDRVNRRGVASATLAVQLAGVALLARAPTPVGVYAGCALFGLGVGNLTTLPGLDPRRRVAARALQRAGRASWSGSIS